MGKISDGKDAPRTFNLMRNDDVTNAAGFVASSLRGKFYFDTIFVNASAREGPHWATPCN
jgi:hypothetical protein